MYFSKEKQCFSVFWESNWLCLVSNIEEINSKYGIKTWSRWLTTNKLTFLRHNIKIHSHTSSCLICFVLCCFFNSTKCCLLITRRDRVAVRCSGSSGACWLTVAGLVLCAAAASLEWMQIREARICSPSKCEHWLYLSITRIQPRCRSAYLFRGPKGRPPSCTFL